MTKRNFRVGQKVIFDPVQGSLGPVTYVVQELLQRENESALYHIKSRDNESELVVRESELESIN